MCSRDQRTVASPRACGRWSSAPVSAFRTGAVLSRGDEYRTTSAHLADTTSILNIGNQLRNRHFTTFIEELNKMVAGVTWTVASIRN